MNDDEVLVGWLVKRGYWVRFNIYGGDSFCHPLFDDPNARSTRKVTAKDLNMYVSDHIHKGVTATMLREKSDSSSNIELRDVVRAWMLGL